MPGLAQHSRLYIRSKKYYLQSRLGIGSRGSLTFWNVSQPWPRSLIYNLQNFQKNMLHDHCVSKKLGNRFVTKFYDGHVSSFPIMVLDKNLFSFPSTNPHPGKSISFQIVTNLDLSSACLSPFFPLLLFFPFFLFFFSFSHKSTNNN
uniref:Uncharacterized protein n=1 Tax=Opuntia streptacantha TaxID=393608 RepID=A0A7C9CU99_OPUST